VNARCAEVVLQLTVRLRASLAKNSATRGCSRAWQKSQARTPSKPPSEPLSNREVEVLRLIAEGQTNPQIARNLLVSVSMVKDHVQHIIQKLGVSDRTQAAVRAAQLGLLSARHE
jgi:DNA-binding NarL/FixJ family response regulator